MLAGCPVPSCRLSDVGMLPWSDKQGMAVVVLIRDEDRE
jgi:hypothetical protein